MRSASASGYPKRNEQMRIMLLVWLIGLGAWSGVAAQPADPRDVLLTPADLVDEGNSRQSDQSTEAGTWAVAYALGFYRPPEHRRAGRPYHVVCELVILTDPHARFEPDRVPDGLQT